MISFTTLIEGLRKSRKIEEAFRLTERMLKESIIPDILTFNYLVQDLCNVGRTVDADKLRLLASSKGLEPDDMTLYTLVYGNTTACMHFVSFFKNLNLLPGRGNFCHN